MPEAPLVSGPVVAEVIDSVVPDPVVPVLTICESGVPVANVSVVPSVKLVPVVLYGTSGIVADAPLVGGPVEVVPEVCEPVVAEVMGTVVSVILLLGAAVV